jgi:hypothetical protein
VGIAIEGGRAFHIAEESSIFLQPQLLQFGSYVLFFPEFADVLFEFKRVIAFTEPSFRIGLEFDGHLSLTHPANPRQPGPHI